MDWHSEEWKESGWAKMSVILDREMPQKKKRRRFFLMWFGLAGLVLVTAGLIWSRSGKLDAVDVIIPAVTQEQSAVTSNQHNNLANHSDATPIIDSIETNTKSTVVEADDFIENINPNEVRSNELYQNSEASKSKRILIESEKKAQNAQLEPAVSVSPEKKIMEVVVDLPVSDEKSNKKNKSIKTKNGINNVTTSVPEKSAAHVTKRDQLVIYITKLPVLDLRIDDFERAINWVEMKDWEAPVLVKAKKEFSPKWTAELFAGAYPGLNTYKFGWNSGISAGYRFAPKWTLKLGAAWGRHQFENLNFYGVSDALVATDPLGDVNTEFVTPEYDPQVAQKKSLSYIDVPLQLNFYLSDHWYTYAGYQLSFLLSINDPFSLNAETDLVASGQEERVVELDPYTQELLVRRNSAVIGGIGYQIGRFSFQAGYQHGVTNLISAKIETESSIYRRNVSIQLFFEL